MNSSKEQHLFVFNIINVFTVTLLTSNILIVVCIIGNSELGDLNVIYYSCIILIMQFRVYINI